MSNIECAFCGQEVFTLYELAEHTLDCTEFFKISCQGKETQT